MRGVLLGMVLSLAIASPGAGQDRGLPPDVSPRVRAGFRVQADSAGRRGVPVAPLMQKVLEGVARGAPDDLILSAVRSLRVRMERAADVLVAPEEDELAAAADALFAGMDEDGLRELAEAVGGQSLLTPLTVFTDLVGRGVALDAASGTVLDLARAGVGEGDLIRFRGMVLRDIAQGMDPGTAARARARAYLRPGGPGPSHVSAAAWQVAGALRPASGSAQVGLGLVGSTPMGSDGLANVAIRGWTGAAAPAMAGQAVPLFEMTAWGGTRGTGWYGSYRRHEVATARLSFSEASVGAGRTLGGTSVRAVGSALWSTDERTTVKGGTLEASFGRSYGPAEIELSMRGGGSLRTSVTGRDTVFQLGPYTFRSERTRLLERSRYFGDVGVLARVEQGPFSAMASVGHRMAPSPLETGLWLDASAGVEVGSRTSVLVRGGWARPDPWGLRAGGSWIQAGLDLRIWGPPPEEAPGDEALPAPPSSSRTAPVRCTDGGAVWSVVDQGEAGMEWMGDASDWTPRAMTRSGGRWVSTEPLAQGRYRLLVRARGRTWVPPPELPVVVDEFGSAGLLVVEACGT